MEGVSLIRQKLSDAGSDCRDSHWDNQKVACLNIGWVSKPILAARSAALQFSGLKLSPPPFGSQNNQANPLHFCYADTFSA
jgi:hypothetical protein